MMVKDHHFQLRYHPLLLCSLKWFHIKTATAPHPVIQKEMDKLLAKGPLNHLLVVLAFTEMYLWFISVQVVYNTYSILSHLITTCAYILLRCLLSDRYGNILSNVIMFS